MPHYHIAQVNIGRIRAELDDPIMAGFVNRLDEINALADASPGFVWRLQTNEGNATYFRPFGDERTLLNMSVWEDIDSLRHYVYQTAHRELLRQRHAWFEKFEGGYMALWWVPVGHIPGIDEAKGRIAHLDLTIVCEAPRIGEHRDRMRANIANLAGIGIERVGVKATTSERLGFTGRGEGIAAYATATIRLPWDS